MSGLPWSLEFRATTAGFVLEPSFDAATGHLDLRLTSTARRSRTVRAITIEAPLDLPAPSGFARLNAATSDGIDTVREFAVPSTTAHGRAAVRHRSEGWIAIVCPARSSPAIVLGSVDTTGRPPQIELELDASETVMRSLSVTVDLAGARVAPGEAISAAFYVVEGRDIDALAAAYADALVAGQLAVDIPPAALNGVVVVTGEGDLSVEAAAIRAAGRLPSLRMAPLALDSEPETVRDHPDWAIAGSTAGPILDCSNPAARDWLEARVRRSVQEQGFTSLDLCGLSAALSSGPAGGANVRAALQAIRSAAGGGTFLLAHDVPLAMAAGLVDAVVAAPAALAAEPAAVAAAAQTALLRGVIHERWWNGAIDLPRNGASPPGASWRTALTAAAMSGFIPVLPPDFDRLPDDRREALAALLPATGLPADPMTPIPADGLSVWSATLPGGRVLVGIFNWNDRPRWVSPHEYLRPGEVAFDFWGARLLGMGDVLLDPWDAMLWQVAGQGRGARLIGDAASITSATLFHRSVSGRLQLGNDLDRPRIVAVHARGDTYAVTLQPGERRWFD